MPCKGSMRAYSRAPLRVAATLLLVDGRFIRAAEIVRIALPYREPAYGVPGEIDALRRAGCLIERGPRPTYGYRLVSLPPDALLDDVLLMAHEIEVERPTRLWELIGARPAMAPSLIRASRWSA